jgi:hypothetical protein
MRGTALCSLTAGLVLLAGAAWIVRADDKKDDDGFKPLFNGKDLTGWKTYLAAKDADPAKTWTVRDGVIHCTGLPFGYFYTDKSFKNYVIKYDWRYPKEQPEKTTLNSGLLVHIKEPHKVWPLCIEAQGQYANHGKIFLVSFTKELRDKAKTTDDADARKKALKPKEEWHTTEVTCKGDGTIEVKVNGIPLAGAKTELTEGPIGFQSEGAAIEFRNIKIKELK